MFEKYSKSIRLYYGAIGIVIISALKLILDAIYLPSNILFELILIVLAFVIINTFKAISLEVNQVKTLLDKLPIEIPEEDDCKNVVFLQFSIEHVSKVITNITSQLDYYKEKQAEENGEEYSTDTSVFSEISSELCSSSDNIFKSIQSIVTSIGEVSMANNESAEGTCSILNNLIQIDKTTQEALDLLNSLDNYDNDQENDDETLDIAI